jgi:hypothetical protein
MEVLSLFYRLDTVSGLSTNVQTCRLDKRPKQVPNRRIVICDEDVFRHSRHLWDLHEYPLSRAANNTEITVGESPKVSNG